MKHPELSTLSDEQFRRLTGIKRITFSKIFKILNEPDQEKKKAWRQETA